MKKPPYDVHVAMNSRLARPKPASVLRYVPIAIHFLPGSRNWSIPRAVLNDFGKNTKNFRIKKNPRSYSPPANSLFWSVFRPENWIWYGDARNISLSVNLQWAGRFPFLLKIIRTGNNLDTNTGNLMQMRVRLPDTSTNRYQSRCLKN